MSSRCLLILGLAVAGALAACAGAWRRVDAQRGIIQVVGMLEVLDIPEHGDVRLEVVPVDADRYALAPGQTRLVCILHEADRKDMQTALLNVRVGLKVRVAGYWMAHDEPGGARHYLNDTTALGVVD